MTTHRQEPVAAFPEVPLAMDAPFIRGAAAPFIRGAAALFSLATLTGTRSPPA